MSKLPLKDIQGNQQGEYDIPENLLVFDKGTQAVHDVVVAMRAKARSGSASTKTRAEVAGSGAKPWRQKGLGRARSGTKQSPIWRGGGVAFGPKPRSYEKRIPKKVARLAFRRAFSEKVASGEVLVLNELSLSEPKTKQLNDIIKGLGVSGSSLLLIDKIDTNIKLAARNLAEIKIKHAKDLNTYDLLRYTNIIVVKSGMESIEMRLGAHSGS